MMIIITTCLSLQPLPLFLLFSPPASSFLFRVFISPHYNDLLCKFLSCLAAFSFPLRGSTEDVGMRNQRRERKRHAAACRCSWSTMVNWVQAFFFCVVESGVIV
jgi:hypothetical protein